MNDVSLRSRRTVGARSVAIAGAGMAGTSLACALVERGYDGEIVVYDGRDDADAARTWCWWDTPGIPFRNLASSTWPAWRVTGGGRDIVRSSSAHPYVRVRGVDFYADARRRLHGSRVRFVFGARVRSVENGEDAGLVRFTSGEVVEAGVAIDARGKAPRPGTLTQRFAGRFVRVRDAVFDVGVATLMHFRTPGPDLAAFTYVLPVANDRALIEDTVLTMHGADDAERLRGIDRYVEETLHTSIVEVEGEEGGAIPLDPSPPPRPRAHLAYAGGAAGAIRASSGFTFVRTQRHVAALAAAIVDGSILPRCGGLRYRTLDAALLLVMRSGLVRPPAFFTAFFEHNDASAVARFLSDASTPADDLKLLMGVLRSAV